MPADMTISKVGERREWEGQHGKMVTYKLELEGHGPAELNQKPETIPPVVGQSVFGDLVPSSNPAFPPKLRKAQKQGGFNGGSKVSPEQQRSIERQVAAKIAADLVIGGKVEFDQFRVALDRIHAAIQGEA